jgi:hypothetical protein
MKAIPTAAGAWIEGNCASLKYFNLGGEVEEVSRWRGKIKITLSTESAAVQQYDSLSKYDYLLIRLEGDPKEYPISIQKPTIEKNIITLNFGFLEGQNYFDQIGPIDHC